MDLRRSLLNAFSLLFLFCELIGCKKSSSNNLGGSSQCQRCKMLSKSFNYWLDKTSRGKFEGGDTAWEEAKLKSYSRSEVRLVEIQEGLCSDLETEQDACYAMAEEVENVLEMWWFSKDPVSVDLYSWLCIETLQHCCPNDHYGNKCTLCPQGKNRKICGGHGRCDGAGTRQGNGTCICKRGYMGNTCDVCAKNFYLTGSGSCKSCHKSCDSCFGPGDADCEACHLGWQLKVGMCVDINECSSTVCNHNQYCINTEGSYHCELCDLSCRTCSAAGPAKCMSCDESNTLWFGRCIDYKQKELIISNTYSRIILYGVLLLINLILYLKHSKSVASIVLLVISIVLYYVEYHNLTYKTIDVVLDQLLTSIS